MLVGRFLQSLLAERPRFCNPAAEPSALTAEVLEEGTELQTAVARAAVATVFVVPRLAQELLDKDFLVERPPEVSGLAAVEEERAPQESLHQAMDRLRLEVTVRPCGPPSLQL